MTDDTCTVTIEATDNDVKKPNILVQKIKINVIEQKFIGVPVPLLNSTNINVPSGEPPTIVKSEVNRNGLFSIKFN